MVSYSITDIGIWHPRMLKYLVVYNGLYPHFYSVFFHISPIIKNILDTRDTVSSITILSEESRSRSNESGPHGRKLMHNGKDYPQPLGLGVTEY